MEIKDSGQRSDFGTGSVRDMQTGKGRMDLMPMRALLHLSKLYEAGCLKYGDRNWEKGQPLGKSYMNSGLRHALKFMMGWTDEDHLVAACWNFMCCLDTILRIREGLLPQELDDIPNKPSGWAMFGPVTPPPVPAIPAPALVVPELNLPPAPSPSDLGPGYRLLEDGEEIQRGDQWQSQDGSWQEHVAAGQRFDPGYFRPHRRSCF